MSIRFKMMLGFGLMVIILLAVGLFGNTMFQRVSVRTTEISESWLPRIQSLERIRTLVSEFRRWELTLVINNENYKKGDIEAKIKQTVLLIDKERQNYEVLITSDEERIIYGNFTKQWEYYKSLHSKVADLKAKNDAATALKLVESESETIHDNIFKTLDTLASVSGKGAQNARADSQEIISKTAVYSLFVIAAGVVTAVVVSYLLIISVIRPARELLGAARAVAGGDLSRRVDSGTSDELGKLAGAFNDMSDRLMVIVSRIAENAQSLAASSQQLSASGQEVSSAIQEMNTTTSEVAALSEMNASEAREASAKAGKVLAAADRGMISVRETEQAMTSINLTSADAAVSVRQLNEFTDKIGSITELITSVAEQTNLLALNAAIEAARAGEQGRGFAVVADEVRSLAVQSEKAAKDISALIQRVQDETQSTVKAMESVSSEIARGVSTVNNTGRFFEEIINQIRETVENVGEVVEGSVKSSQGISQFAQSTQQINLAVQQIAASSQELAIMSGELQKEVEQFKLN